MRRLFPMFLLCVLPLAAQIGPAQSGAGSATGTAAPPQPATEGEPPAVTPQKPASIEGKILARSGEPLRKAEVNVNRVDKRDATGHKVTTDDGGKFKLSDLEPGKYMLRAQKPGYVMQSYGARKAGPSAGSIITLTEGQEMTNVTLQLTPQAVIIGKVLDSDGEPVPRCQVMAMQQRNMRGKKQWMPIMGGGGTNDVGEYRLAPLAPGRYILQVMPQRMNFGETTQAPKDGVEEGYVTTYYPNAIDIAQAVPVDVPAGGEMRAMNFKLAKTRVFRVKGKLVDSTGKPVTNLPLSLMRNGDSNNMMGMFGAFSAFVRDPAGTFEITNVTPGSYTLTAPAAMRDEKRRVVWVPVEVGTKNIDNLVAVATEGAELTGSVRVEGDDKAQLGNVNISLEPTGPMPFGFGSARVKDDKTFKVEGATGGKFRVNVFMMQDNNTYLKAVLYGGQDVLASGLDLTNGGGGSIEVVLGANAGKVTGSVQDDKKKGIPGVTVVLVPESGKRELQHLYKTMRTDQNGNFSLSGIAPGEYTAFAWEDLEDQSYQDPEFLKKYDGSGVTVKLKEGESQNVQLNMIPAAASSE